MSVLENLQPQRVFHYFEEITKIPHGSGNTKEMSDYLVNFAKEHGLRYIQDESNNVILFKPAAKGYENALQSCFKDIWTWCVRKPRQQP